MGLHLYTQSCALVLVRIDMNECTSIRRGRGRRVTYQYRLPPSLLTSAPTHTVARRKRLHPTQHVHLTHRSTPVEQSALEEREEQEEERGPLTSLGHSRQLAMVLFPISS